MTQKQPTDEMVTVSLAELCEKHRKAGRRDVVEFLTTEYSYHTEAMGNKPTRRVFKINQELWQAKLKEWQL